MKWIVTGGAGFIGSHFVRTAIEEQWCDEIVVVDALTYAGNLSNLESVRDRSGFQLVKADITDVSAVTTAFDDGADAVFHFAAESHVDRSIDSASAFVETNVLGTQVLLDVARAKKVDRFVHVSTDEVYGSLELGTTERFAESTPLDPTSPYAASKTASDHLVLAAQRTHGLNAVVTRCSNNYGPFQFPEKFIPLFITNALNGEDMPLYGDGLYVRDWIHVDNHVRGIKLACERGVSGEVYNLGGDCERANRDIAYAIADIVGGERSSIKHVRDRPAHDRRYAIDASKARSDLGFDCGPPIEDRLEDVVAWYRDNRSWWTSIKNGDYREYYARFYGDRLG